MKQFVRVCNPETQQGLWYDFKGNFTGLIHNEFKFCKNHALAMDYDEELKGYLSAAVDMDQLYFWFSKEDILQLQEHGYFIHVYETDDYKFYERFQHYVINQQKAKLVDKIILYEENQSVLSDT